MTTLHPPAHRRQSSQWVPPTGPLYNPVEIFKGRSSRVKGSRMIQPNHIEEAARYDLPNYRHFTNNSISTTKYSWLTFIPLNIFHQLKSRYANFYFLLIAGLNFIPALGAYSKWLALVPPCFVFGTTMLKDGYEDWRRRRLDKEINSRMCHVWDRSRQMFRKMQWKYILVGDIVHVSNDQDIPADLLFIRSSNDTGTCFVETSNLDGETSLKQRHVPRRYLSFSGEESGFKPSEFTGTLFCEKPDKSIHAVRAKIEYEPENFEAVVKENMILRGSRLKNTTFIEGVVMYAGHDTKVMMNNGRAPLKISQIERLTNKFILICVLILVALIVPGCFLAAYFIKRHEDPFGPFVPSDSPSPAVDGVQSIGTFLISYQVLVPISLYITIEFIKLGQIFFISQDIELYDEETDYSINCRALNIPEELGQITHVLSDKTGTLTENKMIFRNCAVDDVDYGGEFDPAKLDPSNPVASPSLRLRVKNNWKKDHTLRHFFMNILVNNSVVVNKTPHQDTIEVGTFQAGIYTIGNTAFYDVTMEQFLKKVDEHKNQPMARTRFEMRADSFSSSDEESPTEPSRTSSPMDSKPVSTVVSRVSSVSKNLANVFRRNIVSPIHSSVTNIKTILSPTSSNAFKWFNLMDNFCPYEAESPDEMALIQGAVLYDFKLIDRTGTHVTVERPDFTQKKIPIRLILPFDSKRKRMSVVIESGRNLILYTKGADSAILSRLCSTSDSIKIKLSAHIHRYSCHGLRTLCFAMKRISEDEFEEMKQSYEQIMMDSTEGREDMLSDLGDHHEKELTLLGVTGIEDRLQEGVNDTIVSMRQAGIQVWVLTGDKLETAENIARASGLFSEATPLLRISKPEDVKPVQITGYSLVLNTSALKMLQGDGDPLLVKLLQGSDSVLCYRMTPAEKAMVVKTVQKHLKGNVLAIGDGANDVPMIQAAHVGIGVKGKEGMQAVMACDYAIPRFYFLKKLLLVHGHWCYHRLALSFLYFLYKNTNNVFILFFYQFFCGYSGSFTIDPTYSVLYPIIFTSVQPILVGVLDQDKSVYDLTDHPESYESGRLGTLYTTKLFLANMIDGIWQAAVMFFFCYYTLWESEESLWTFGFYLSTTMMLVNCSHLAIEVRSWTTLLSGVFVFFFVLHFGYFCSLSVIAQPGLIPDPPIEIAQNCMEDIRFWACMIAVLIVSLLPRFLLRIASYSGFV